MLNKSSDINNVCVLRCCILYRFFCLGRYLQTAFVLFLFTTRHHATRKASWVRSPRKKRHILRFKYFFAGSELALQINHLPSKLLVRSMLKIFRLNYELSWEANSYLQSALYSQTHTLSHWVNCKTFHVWTESAWYTASVRLRFHAHYMMWNISNIYIQILYLLVASISCSGSVVGSLFFFGQIAVY